MRAVDKSGLWRNLKVYPSPPAFATNACRYAACSAKEKIMSKYLVGHTIREMKIADDKKAILFITDKENVIAKMDGDCCSDTWVEHIEMVSLPALVLDVDDIDMPNLGNPDEYEVVAYYGCKITTDKGHIIIDYRNSSNGYYGGNISFPDDSYFYGGVYGQNVSKEVWKDIAAA